MTIKISKISEKWHNAWYNVGNLMQLVDTCEKAGNSASALASAFTKHKSTERSSKLWSCEAEWMLYFASQGKHGVHPLWSLYASTSEGDGKSGADLIDIVCKGDAPKGATTEQKAELTAMRDKIVAVMQKHPDQAIARSFGRVASSCQRYVLRTDPWGTLRFTD